MKHFVKLVGGDISLPVASGRSPSPLGPVKILVRVLELDSAVILSALNFLIIKL